MNIDRTSPVPASAGNNGLQEQSARRGMREQPGLQIYPTEQHVTLSPQARQLETFSGQDPDESQVPAIRHALAEGSYEIDYQKIASALVNDISQLS